MAKLDYTLYDTALFGVAVAEYSLFQNSQGSGAAFTKSITNMRGAGALPTSESFECQELHVYYEENPVIADALNVWLLSYLEFFVNDEQQLLIPLVMCASHNAFGGHYTEVAASDTAAIGQAGNGFMLKIPIMIPGGTQFRVNVYQGTVLSGASLNVKVIMRGVLDRR